MMAPSPSLSRRRRALQAAAELLDELDIDQDRPVDVFAAIDRLDLWLVFQPLASLLGVVLPAGGIMITTERPPTVQRYTAAHEIAHWSIDHNPTAFDTEADVFHYGGTEREQLAQWFASYFLMPPSLVHGTASRYGVRTGTPPSPVEAYLIARDMHVSYEAAIRQMDNLRLITGHEREALLGVPPLSIKKQLAHGHRPRNGRADVWPVDERSLHHRVEVAIDDEIVIGLPENRTTGFRWLDAEANARRSTLRARPAPPAFAPPTSPHAIGSAPTTEVRRTGADVAAALALLPPASQSNSDAQQTPMADAGPHDELLVVSDEYQADGNDLDTRSAARLRRAIAGAVPSPTTDDPAASATENAAVAPSDPEATRIGATGRRWLVLQAQAEGRFTYLLYYAAPHDPASAPAATFTVEATVEPSPEVVNRRRLLQVDLGEEDVVDEDTDSTDPRVEDETDR
ncbi:ImmA/IrrE family metallo-endopeptidase [Amycolatopsis anabasis]|uniref:ImmA/IrrE family metallo-endopeptidase n=1 Tax=Amycolatopsis anabasis TaxID=1840409 RepID=UPI00131E5E4B|nr:ImmA/IrrE family metallo-endopeptidase [Amycolatopsis anabasis]